MNLALITNPVAGQWHPTDLSKFLGGNEESVVLLTAAIAKTGVHVDVFTSLRGPEWISPEGVLYHQREAFNPLEEWDAVIAWKDRALWLQPLAAKLKIHASQDVEPPFSTGAMRQIDRFATLGTYHNDRLPWVPNDRRMTIPLGVEPSEYAPNGDKAHLAIYATSPDRGLETLLNDWGHIRRVHPGLRLLITYDWTRLETMSGPQGALYARKLQSLIGDQPGIERATYDAQGIKTAFQRAEYYVHPLHHPDADLFGFGAMKAQACGCKLVLSGLECGFRDMAREWIPYSEWKDGRTEAEINPRFCQPATAWSEIVERYWLPLLTGKEASGHAA